MFAYICFSGKNPVSSLNAFRIGEFICFYVFAQHNRVPGDHYLSAFGILLEYKEAFLPGGTDPDTVLSAGMPFYVLWGTASTERERIQYC